jgi:hypothetical protein
MNTFLEFVGLTVIGLYVIFNIITMILIWTDKTREMFEDRLKKLENKISEEEVKV